MITFDFFMLLFSSHRPKSTPTPTASLSANGVPSDAVDYDRLKQVSQVITAFSLVSVCVCLCVQACLVAKQCGVGVCSDPSCWKAAPPSDLCE